MKHYIFRFYLLLPTLLCLVTGCGETKKEDKKSTGVGLFSWLNGNWLMKDKDGTTTEEWTTVNDSMMEGKSDFIKGDSVIPFETIKIFKQDTSFIYEAKAAGQNNELPVQFRLSSFSDSGFVAENPSHDFPKRITYRLINKDSLHAFIDGGSQQADKRADFYYSKQKK